MKESVPHTHVFSWTGSREQYRYDAVGNPVGYTTRAGQVRTSVFDNRNREIQTNWSDSTPDITRSFDAAGRVLSEDNGAVALTYSYNAANQVLSETTQLNGQPAHTVGYAYDAAGRLASTTYPGGNVVAQSYTPRGQIAGIGLDGGTVASYEYNPVGATTAKTLENGMTTLYRYDAAQRLLGLEHRKGLDLLAKIDYTLDKVGNRRSKTQNGINPLNENYNYDAVDQLIEAKYGTARTVGYQYDAVGNRQWVSDNGTTAHYTANADNGYTSVGGISTQTDLNGNMVSVPGAAYAYDAQNRLTSATVNGVTTEFTYDSRNRVVRRTSGNGTLNLTYSGWHLIEERNASGALDQVYVHGAGTDEILVKITPAGPAYYHHDGLGSTIALTGENGELLESYRYDAFGAVTVYGSPGSALPASPRGNRFLFTGREWLRQAGLYDYRNRVYSAQIGRFLQTDPIRFAAGDVNIYRYCGNEPVNWFDPDGLKVEVCSRRIVGPFGSHTWVKVTDSNGESTTYSGTKEGDNLGVKKNDPSDTNPNRPSGGIEVPPPDGMSQDQWDQAVKDSGDRELDKHNKRGYDPFGGDGGKKSGNCHSTTSDIIEGAGGKIPKYDPPGANPGLRTK